MKILLIDEDKASMHYYVLALKKSDFEVVHCRKPDTALDAIRQDGASFSLIILDSAMPPGQVYASEKTDDGTLTGKLLYRDIRVKLPDVPILILTNFLGLEWIQSAIADKNVKAERKINVSPLKLVDIITQMVK
jgi:DNA-binding response OmpR family regulator